MSMEITYELKYLIINIREQIGITNLTVGSSDMVCGLSMWPFLQTKDSTALKKMNRGMYLWGRVASGVGKVIWSRLSNRSMSVKAYQTHRGLLYMRQDITTLESYCVTVAIILPSIL